MIIASIHPLQLIVWRPWSTVSKSYEQRTGTPDNLKAISEIVAAGIPGKQQVPCPSREEMQDVDIDYSQEQRRHERGKMVVETCGVQLTYLDYRVMDYKGCTRRTGTFPIRCIEPR